MTKLNCIIVEDEPIARDILADYIASTPQLYLSHMFQDAIAALDIVHSEPIDVIFLDINLPKINGLQFIKTLRRQPKIIITSAHHEYAVEGFDLQVVDYLLKPFDFSRFTMAVQKLLHPIKLPSEATPPASKLSTVHLRPYYFFTVNKRSVKIFLDEILYIESQKDTVAIVTQHKTYPTHYQLGELEALIRSDNFLRIHRSFLVAVDKIDSFSAAEVEIAGRSLPIGRSYKNFIAEKLREG